MKYYLKSLLLLAFTVSNVLAQTSTPYEVKTCLADTITSSCTPTLVTNPIRYQTQPVTSPNTWEDTVGQRGSLSFVDITLPTNKVLYVEVTTNVVGQENVGANNFHVRPSRLTEPWGAPTVVNNVASFYLADTGQYSVEFASSDMWKELLPAQIFDALMLFVNPPMDLKMINDWPTTKSGQCVVGGVYGSSSVKSNYRIHNIFVETACSCAVGLEINKAAFSRHLTPGGCVGSIKNMSITNMFFDDEFFSVGSRSNNYLRGERNPGSCSGDFEGKISDLVVSGDVNGRALSRSDFIVPNRYVSTVPNLVFESVTIDPPSATPSPTPAPTNEPTNAPTTAQPTNVPTTALPTNAPTTAQPTNEPTNAPTTAQPTNAPTIAQPTNAPTTAQPTNAPTTAQPTNAPTTIGNKVTAKIVMETPYDPSKVSWKVKIGSTNIVTGKASTMKSTGNNGYETFVNLDAGIEYKFVVIDNNTIKDTFWEVWSGGDVLIQGDCNCKRTVKYFVL